MTMGIFCIDSIFIIAGTINTHTHHTQGHININSGIKCSADGVFYSLINTNFFPGAN